MFDEREGTVLLRGGDGLMKMDELLGEEDAMKL